MPSEADDIQRLAAEAVVRDTGTSIEQALDGLEFQDRAMTVMDELDAGLGDASGGVWFDWSDGWCRLKIGVTTRTADGSLAPVKRLLESRGLADRTEFVNVFWTTEELKTAQRRANELLKSLAGSWSTALEPDTNSIRIGVPADLTRDQVKIVEAAIRAAAVSVRVETGEWGALTLERA